MVGYRGMRRKAERPREKGRQGKGWGQQRRKEEPRDVTEAAS